MKTSTKQGYFRTTKARLIQSQQARGQQAAQQQQTALTELGTPTSADDAAQRLANVADPILAQKQKDISDAFESVDPLMRSQHCVFLCKNRGSFTNKLRRLIVAQDSKVRQAIKLINEAAGQNKTAKDIPELAMVKPTVPPLPNLTKTSQSSN